MVPNIGRRTDVQRQFKRLLDAGFVAAALCELVSWWHLRIFIVSSRGTVFHRGCRKIWVVKQDAPATAHYYY
jgi:hypothetical protein